MTLKDRVFLSNLALNQRILVPLNVISVIALSALGVVVMKGSTSVFRETMDSKIEFAANFLERASIPFLASNDLAALESFVMEAEKDSDIAFVGFFDLQQKGLTRGTKLLPRDERDLQVIQREVRGQDGKLLGYAKLAYFNHRVENAVGTTLLVVVLAAILVQLVLTLALRAVTRSVSDHIGRIVERLTDASTTIFNSSSEMSASSESLSEGVAKQAAAVQETVASMAEMSSMLAQTATNARNCYTLTGKAAEKTKTGTRTMEQLVSAMGSIESANAQLTNMVNIIREISTKTNVINEIVFKTQLLSLNASIEAARAGQHGRGFAVVAEEVGNLAQMSGSAAKEISALLESSLREVQQIVRSTEERVREGRGVSDSALRAFNEIANDISSISAQIQAINEAAREQELGVKQSSNALILVDETTLANNNVARQVLASAMLLAEQSKQITEITRSVRTLIFGVRQGREFNGLGESSARESSLVDAVMPSLAFAVPSALSLKSSSVPVPPREPTDVPTPLRTETVIPLEISVAQPPSAPQFTLQSAPVGRDPAVLAQRIAQKAIDPSSHADPGAVVSTGPEAIGDISADDESFQPAQTRKSE